MTFHPDKLRQRLSGRPRARVDRGRRAAVLVPIWQTTDATRLLFMKRPDTASKHAGEVSFPGGGAETDDRDSSDTALREANEELGIISSSVDVLGWLDDMFTVSDYAVTPVVGWLREEPTILASQAEVADHFWLDLKLLQNQELWRSQDMPWRGRVWTTWFFDGGPHLLWGATARIVRDLLEEIDRS